jgi:hypothetical protein
MCFAQITSIHRVRLRQLLCARGTFESSIFHGIRQIASPDVFHLQPNTIDIFSAADCHPSPTDWNMKKWQRRHNAIPLHVHPIPPTRIVFFLHQTREAST